MSRFRPARPDPIGRGLGHVWAVWTGRTLAAGRRRPRGFAQRGVDEGRGQALALRSAGKGGSDSVITQPFRYACQGV